MLMRNLLGVVGAVLLFANCTSQQKENEVYSRPGTDGS